MRLPAFVCLSVSKFTQKRVHGFGSDMAMGWVHPLVGLGPKFSPMKMGWVGFSCQKLILFFSLP